MATIKSYTDLEQSKKLAKILPIDSADMHILEASCFDEDSNETAIIPTLHLGKPIKGSIPCWSLAALLDVLPKGIIMHRDYQNGRYHFSSTYIGTYVTADNPIDACYEIILKLHELNLL